MRMPKPRVHIFVQTGISVGEVCLSDGVGTQMPVEVRTVTSDKLALGKNGSRLVGVVDPD